MKPNATLPFRTSLGRGVDLGLWHLEGPDEDLVRLSGEIPGWDYTYPIKLRRSLALDATAIREETRLPKGVPLQLTVVINSPPAKYRACVLAEDLTDPRCTIQLEVTVESFRLSGYFFIETSILLGKSISPRSFRAHLKGSRLYEETVRVLLEGTASRFPVQLANFQDTFARLMAPKARWYLSWSLSDLHLPMMQAVSLILNSSNEAFVTAAGSAEIGVLDSLSIDITRQLLERTLDEEEFLEDAGAFEDGSIGDAVFLLMQSCFPGMLPKDVKAMRDNERGRFEAMIQSAVGG